MKEKEGVEMDKRQLLIEEYLDRGIINTYQSEENKKEIYFQLTPIGQKIRNRHEQLHQKWVQRDATVFENMSKEEFDTVFRFIGRYREFIRSSK